MNLLTINTYDCSADASGGINRMTALLTPELEKAGIGCFFGYFLPLAPSFNPAPFRDRIHLNIPFDEDKLEKFLIKNKIDIIQINYLRKEFLIKGTESITRVAQHNNVKTIYAFHMCPGFQTVTNGTLQRMLYGYLHNDQALKQTLYWLLSSTKPIWQPISNLLLRKKYLIPYNLTDRTVVLSQHYIQPYAQLCGIKDTSKLTAIGNSLRYTDFVTADDIQKKDKTVLVVARFDEHTKRLSYVLRCWKKIEQCADLQYWRLQLVGTGGDERFYRYLTDKYQLRRVEFAGLQDPHDYYLHASLFCMTSTAEGWGMTLTEAAQLGVPAIAMDSFGAVHDIITDGYNSTIVPNNDLKAFYNAMVALMSNDNKRRQMSLNAVESSHRFEIDNVVNQWLNLFEQLQDK